MQCEVKDVKRKMGSSGHCSEFSVQQGKRMQCGGGGLARKPSRGPELGQSGMGVLGTLVLSSFTASRTEVGSICILSVL